MAEEKADVLDERGNKTGEILPLGIVHERELWHGSVFVWIINSKKEILFQFRAESKQLNPSCWDTSVAGHIVAGDKPEVSGVREVNEEIGTEIKVSDLNFLGKFSEEGLMTDGKVHREHMFIFSLYRELDIASLKIQQEELTAVKWIPAKELEHILSDPKRRKELSSHEDKLFRFAIQAAQRS